MLLLLAEDDLKIAKLIKHLLEKDGYQVDHAKDGCEALEYAKLNHYDLIILDWMMPGKTGIEVCTLLRRAEYHGGIILLTAKDTLSDKVQGLDSGADDYLVKPFEYQELYARIKSLLRRSSGIVARDILEVGNIAVNKTEKNVLIDGVNLNLSRKEYQLFEFLFENRGAVLTRELMIDKIWGLDGEVTDNNLDSFIKLLRKKIEKCSKDRLIQNVRGIGYKMEV